MKKGVIIFCILSVTTMAHGAFDIAGWSWQRPIDVSKVSGFVRLSVPPEVFNESQISLNDLRVLDESNSLVPHLIHWGRIREVRQQEWRSARLVNATFVPGKYSRVTVDFGETVEKNLILVSLAGQNYRRRAPLEGSHESTRWEVVAEDLWLFHMSVEGQSFRIDTLKFPVNTFRYLRLTVYNMADDPRRITIDSVKGAFLRIEMEKELVPVPVKQQGLSRSEEKKQSSLEVDLGFRHLPIVSLGLEVATPYLYRGYELYGRNELKKRVPRTTETGSDMIEQETPWTFVHRGVFYRIQEKNKSTEFFRAEDLNAPYRYLKLRIFNGDNPPLQITGVSVHRRETSLLFQAQAGKQYRLMGGNLKVGAADYDLARAVQGLDDMKLPLVGLGAPTVIAPKAKLPPWTERYSAVIWIVLILAVGVMVGFIVKNLKKLPATRK